MDSNIKFLINHKTQTIIVSIFESSEVIQRAAFSAKNLGYNLVLDYDLIRKVA